MSARTMSVSTIDYTPTAAELNTSGLVPALWRELRPRLDTRGAKRNSPQPAPRSPVGRDQPERIRQPNLSAGHVRGADAGPQNVTLAGVNATKTGRSFDLNVAGLQLQGRPTLWQITGKI